ncbi:MAG: trimethylamine methyltransferase family protein, partial [Candidatus Limnocylindrales bacterium]
MGPAAGQGAAGQPPARAAGAPARRRARADHRGRRSGGRAGPCRVVRPRLELLEPALVERVLGEAFELLADPGVRVGSPEAAELLAGAGASVGDGVARLPEALVRQALATVPGK